MNEPQEPRSLREVLDDLKRIGTDLKRTLDGLEVSINSVNSLTRKFKLLFYLAVVGNAILLLVVLGQR